jgi:hypothetical protein
MGLVEVALVRVRAAELAAFEDELAEAVAQARLVLVRTPADEDCIEGVEAALAAITRTPGLNPHRVLLTRAEEHTLAGILDAGCWAGIALEATSAPRVCDMVEVFGHERLCVTVTGGCGPASPMDMPGFWLELRRRGHSEGLLRRLVFDNALDFLSQLPALSRRPVA